MSPRSPCSGRTRQHSCTTRRWPTSTATAQLRPRPGHHEQGCSRPRQAVGSSPPPRRRRGRISRRHGPRGPHLGHPHRHLRRRLGHRWPREHERGDRRASPQNLPVIAGEAPANNQPRHNDQPTKDPVHMPDQLKLDVFVAPMRPCRAARHRAQAMTHVVSHEQHSHSRRQRGGMMVAEPTPARAKSGSLPTTPSRRSSRASSCPATSA